ncbi:hypothetical protein QP519_11010 [Weeksella virosa]|uniref:hypothetical protein n=1 Tax=Weeksella virosa TaxID=1014 RepID=UPI00255433CE|nr:hypothetical protein [Weeksella virosa]MDK7376061.1 hypothetical protein [Weeksella virosa]MDK7674399.1 hypothetical protein [Weeksella virosa]
MRNINKVQQGQNFLDKVLELTGTIETAIEMADLNGCSVTYSVKINQVIEGSGIRNAMIVQFFRNTPPATAVDVERLDLDSKLEGIDYWAIEIDFIVG